MDISPEVRSRIDRILSAQSIAVLGTSYNNEPYSSLVAFVVIEDFRELIFATMRNRLKYQNIMSNPKVTLMIDDRDKKASDFNETTSISFVGIAEDIRGTRRESYASLLLKRHPSLTDFVSAQDCAVIRVRVTRIYVVSQFESVIVIER